MSSDLMNLEEVSELLGVSKHTIYSWVFEKRIPYIKVGRLLRFSRRETDAWLKVNSIKAF
ncbi:MAG: helix-turn-helix domain-containing protein [Candidatus Omnitrophica bacterium]|nr:helix-turn-helix domain-containing protein [Candidatus Omnitrophota bacterium]